MSYVVFNTVLGVGQLPRVTSRLVVESRDKGLQGLKFHNSPILLRDHPNAPRAKPRFSVMNDIGGALIVIVATHPGNTLSLAPGEVLFKLASMDNFPWFKRRKT